jgi:prepilin-type N-terminal cleavage/methylation domain-containing protein/prepilin-type processing-associated H-X9-DG protein
MKRHGFTLVELLIAIAVVGLLAGLLLPAVQAAREAAREASCRHNLHEFGVWIAGHYDTRGRIPPIQLAGDVYAARCPVARGRIDSDADAWQAGYGQRWAGMKPLAAMESTGLDSTAIATVYDFRRETHDGDRLALFLDGHVERLAADYPWQ